MWNFRKWKIRTCAAFGADGRPKGAEKLFP